MGLDPGFSRYPGLQEGRGKDDDWRLCRGWDGFNRALVDDDPWLYSIMPGVIV